jgi:hypothetical protein
MAVSSAIEYSRNETTTPTIAMLAYQLLFMLTRLQYCRHILKRLVFHVPFLEYQN